MGKTHSPVKRFSTVVLAFAMTLGLSAVGSIASAANGQGIPSATGTAVVEKVDENGTPLAGAELQILDSQGTAVESFTSNGSENGQRFTLPVGNYTLHEVKAPKGYTQASEGDIPFAVQADTIVYPSNSLPGNTVQIGSDCPGDPTCETRKWGKDGAPIEFINIGGGWVPAYCIEHYDPAPATIDNGDGPFNPSYPGETYYKIDLGTYNNQYAYDLHGAELVEALRRIAYYGYGNDAEGLMANYGAYVDRYRAEHPKLVNLPNGRYFQQDATRFAMAVMNHYYAPSSIFPANRKFGDFDPNFGSAVLGPRTMLSGPNEQAMVRTLLDIAKDSSITVPDNFKVAIYRPVNSSAQDVIIGYWTSVVMQNVPGEAPTPEIGTTATDSETKDHIANADGEVTIVDTVSYENLEPNTVYTLKGELKKKSDGSTIATAETQFQATAESGTAELSFTFDGSALKNDAAVAFEELYDMEGTTLLAEHKDINDEGQTVVFPEAETTATDKEDGDHMVDPAASVTVVDKVAYKNLIVGNEYTVSGTLHLKNDDGTDGGELIVDGQPVTATKTFTAEQKDGFVELEFTFKASALAGKTVVAFEEVSYNNVVVAVHEDITDEEQTIIIDVEPEIGTTATDNSDGDKTLDVGTVQVKDVVAYKNLKTDKEYTLKGQLVRKSDQLVIAQAETTFTPATRDGSIELVFNVDTSRFQGEELVVFESLYLGEVEVAVHADINDKGQTVKVDVSPEIGTTATDQDDDDKIVDGSAIVKVKDVVAYKNLKPGKEYTLEGKLVTKSSNGETVLATSTKEFTPQTANGTVEMTFEVSTIGLAGEKLVVFETLSCDGKVVATHADINDEGQTVTVDETPEIATFAYDKATEEQMANADSEVTIVDIVAYRNLKPNTEYTLNGTLVKKSDQSAITTATTTFTTDATGSGLATIEFTFDGSALVGDSAVAFESVLLNGVEVASHADINDEYQTVVFPEAKTTATDKEDGNHTVSPDGEVTVVDRVSYRGLIIGKEYTVSGTLMKKSDGQPLVIDGTPVTATKTFTATDRDGYVELEFTFPASALAGEKIVAFEKVSYGEEVVAVHEDLEDEDQTVIIDNQPEIGTTATDKATGQHMAYPDSEVTIKDVVSYKNLTVGHEYTLKGELVKKSDQSVLAVAEKTFTASAAKGKVTLEFTFNATGLEGDAVVAFERLYYDGVEIASHADINDSGQTVVFPEIGTTATDKEDGDHLVDPAATVTVVDKVSYTNLVKGKEYTVSGTLHVKNDDGTDGGELIVDGQPVTATKTFTATAKNGYVELEFTFNASALIGEKIVAFEKVSYNNVVVAVHEDITDEEQTVVIDELPEIGTTATDKATEEHMAQADAEVTIVDVVSYKNLKVGKKYTLNGKLVKKSDESVIAEASKTFKPKKRDGSVSLEFTFNGSGLENDAVVAFESLVLNGTEVASHADINDEGQTVVFPEAKTTATDKEDGDHTVWPDEVVTVVDKVSYRNLIIGKEYTVSGTLMKKSNGQPLVIDGTPVTATTTFVAEQKDGFVELEFTFNASALAGEKIVAFEKVSYNDEVVAVHEDLEDEDQTIIIDEKPEIGTTATDKATGEHMAMADSEVTIVDKVSYKNLKPGKEYTLNGQLVKKSDQSVLATASATFTPAARDGFVSLEFTFDGTGLENDAVVAFESLVYNGTEVASHADINDKGQTVVFPEAKTTATDKEDGDHTVWPDEVVTIVDKVSYTNLVTGREYTVSGTLMKKSDGQPLVIDGQPVTATKTFKATKKNGFVELEFTFKASALAGEKVVAFEKVSYNDEVVAVHEDITDEEQTVVIDNLPEIGTTATDQADGDKVVDGSAIVKVKDVVAYKNLKPGVKYTLKGQIVTKSSDGATVVAEATKKFTPTERDGSVEMTFTVNTFGLAGEELVVFEQLYWGNKTVASHADLTDAGQTVVVNDTPEIGTFAYDKATEEQMANADSEVTIVDIVAYVNLKGNTEYTLNGTLVKKSDQSVLATASTTFTTDETGTGFTTIEFTFDGSALAGDSAVAFETVLLDGVEVATHADINDEGQTVVFPEAKTTATDKEDGNHVVSPDKQVTVVDKVTYRNLIVGKEYTVSGTLMKKSDGQPLVIDGNPVTATKTFTAEQKDGFVELEFTFNASALVGEKIVAFEKVYYEEEVVAVHEDLEDEEQTVVIDELPEIGTTATDKADGDKYVAIGTVEVKDVVAYKNLKPGKEYTLSGKLVKKSDQSVVAEASRTFTPEAANGTVELVFTVDTSALKGEKLVAFETVSLGEDEVAVHADINDEGQTVTVDEVPEIEKYVNKQVHEDIDLDQVFTYDVVAYVTKDADKVEIYDTLVDDLQFVSVASDVKVADLGETVDHMPHGSVESEGTPVPDASAAINGQKLTVTIDPANAYRGHWVKVTFDAKIKDGLTLDDLEYVNIEKNDPVITDETHEGVPNDASYKIWVDNEGKYEDESNTVTVKPKEPEIGTTAIDAADGDKAIQYGTVAEVKDVVEYKDLKANTTYEMSGKLVTKASGGHEVVATKTVEFTTDETGCGTVDVIFEVDTAAVAGKDLVAFERAIEISKEFVVATHEDINDEGQTVTVDEQPEIEKYVNKDVHSDIVEFDREFTYDVMAYVSGSAASAEIYDTLVDNLEFADANGMPTTDASASVLAVQVKDENDHTANGSVAAEGTPVEGYVASIDGQKLTVKIADATALRGKWVQVTFNARIKDAIRTMDGLNQETISDNTPVISEIAEHTGVPNTASYVLFDNEGKALDAFLGEGDEVVPLESNTVTIVPETVSVDIDKSWVNAEDWDQEAPSKWPRGAIVTAKVVIGETVVTEVTLDVDHQSAHIEGLPKLKAGDYWIDEVNVEGYYSQDARTEFVVDEDGNVTAKLVNRLVPVRSERFLDFAKTNEEGEMLPGAELQLTGTLDFDGSEFPAVTWITEDKPFRVENLVPGTYTLTELKAPVGYRVADPITFVLDEHGNVFIDGEMLLPDEGGADLGVMITMIDPRIPDEIPTPPEPSNSATPTPSSPVTPGRSVNPTSYSPSRSSSVPTTTKTLSKTGISAGWTIVLMASMLATGAGAVVLRRRES